MQSVVTGQDRLPSGAKLTSAADYAPVRTAEGVSAMRNLLESQSDTLTDLHSLAVAERDARERAERSARHWQFATLAVGVMTFLAAVAAVIVAL
jgi:predicted component of type VI protein secretion system